MSLKIKSFLDECSAKLQFFSSLPRLAARSDCFAEVLSIDNDKYVSDKNNKQVEEGRGKRKQDCSR